MRIGPEKTRFGERMVRDIRRQNATMPSPGRNARRLTVAAMTAVGLIATLVASAAVFTPAFAQGWWPWEQQPQQRPPVPQEPVYRPDAVQQPPPVAQPAPGTWGTKNPICFQLEQRLVQESSRGSQSQNLIPMVESELRQVDQSYRRIQADLDRSCYEYFLFSKSLRRTRQCVDLARQGEDLRRRLSDLETQRSELTSSSGRSYQDDIVRELARNNCGEAYQQQARRMESRGAFSDLWGESESSGGPGGGLGNYGNLGYATYRTLCVRLCDGYYFPVSFSTLPNHFQRDAETCQSKCAAPVELYYYQNPGGAVEQAVGVGSNTPYTELKTAFRYRKEYVQGCSCKQAEFTPQSQPQQSGALAPTPGTDAARSTTAAPGAPPTTVAPEPSTGRRAESIGEGWSTDVEQQ